MWADRNPIEELRQQSMLHDAGYAPAGYRACNAPVVAPGPWTIQGGPLLECSWSDREEKEERRIIKAMVMATLLIKS